MCFKNVLRIILTRFKVVLRVALAQKYFRKVSRVFKENDKCLSRISRGVSSVFLGRFKCI